MVQEDIRQGECISQLPVADEGHGAHDADPLLPEGPAAAGEVIEQRPVLVQQPLPQQRVAAQVHQVPVVDPVGMGKVEIDTGALERRILPGMPELLHQRQQRRQPHFMIFTGNARLKLRDTDLLPACLHHRARDGDLDPQEAVALAVLARPGLEEARQAGHLRGVGVRAHLREEDVVPVHNVISTVPCAQ